MSNPLQQSPEINAARQGKTVAVMQPYFLPYIGYWQMMQAVDEFVVFDDVQFTRGWINRNRLLWNGDADTFTVPLLKGSNRANINERFITEAWPEARQALLNKVTHAYGKAPLFAQVLPVVERILDADEPNLADFLYRSLACVQEYLGIATPLIRSSSLEAGQGLRAADRILAICAARGAETYVNAPGGRELYDKDLFRAHGVDLKFIQPGQVTYAQLGAAFVPNLSILDVMMFNTPADIRDMLTRFELV